MKPFIEATDANGREVMIDPNQVKLNAANTNMLVAVYPEKELNRGNQKPIFVNFRFLKVLPEDRQKLEDIFKLEVASKGKETKTKEELFRKHRKNKSTAISKLQTK
ncbi:MAG: hypothetical protein ACOYL8_03045 [Patescibacteria group bacterium]